MTWQLFALISAVVKQGNRMYVLVKEFGDLLLAQIVLWCSQRRSSDREALLLHGRTATLCHSIHFSVFMCDPFLLIFCMQGSISEHSYWCWVSSVACLVFRSWWFTLKCNHFTVYKFGLQVTSLSLSLSQNLDPLVHLVKYSGVKKREGGSSQKLNSWELGYDRCSLWKIQPVAHMEDLLYLK